MARRDASWNFLAALQVFLAALLGDLGVYAARRKALVSHGVAQKKIGSINCLVAGDEGGGTPLIFLHGSPGSALDWHLFLSDPKNYYVVAVDRPGFAPGDAVKPDLKSEVERLGAVLNAMPRAAILAGHSLGGGLCAALAEQYPEKVAGLVFIGASLDPGLEKIFPVQTLFAGALSKFLSQSIRNSNKELLEYAGSFLREVKFPACPVSVIHSHDDALVPFANADYAQAHFDVVNLIALDSGGHFLNETRPDDVWLAIKAIS